MKLTNTTDFPNHFLRRLVSWCCRQVKLPASKLKAAQFTNLSFGGSRGRCSGRSILVRIGAATYFPAPEWLYHGAKNPGCADRLEGLVSVTVHELRHVVQNVEGRSNRCLALREGECVAWERDVLAAFRAKRAGLEAEWSQSPKRAAAKSLPPKASAVERRAAKARADLDRWERKLKLARTKVKKLTARVRYYERKGALPPGQE